VQNSGFRKRLAFAAGITVVFWSVSVPADTVQLDDGSVINGEVQSLASGKVVIQTAFAGKLTIDQEMVTALSTTKEFNFAFESGNVLVGTASVKDGKTEVTTAFGPIDVSKDTLAAVWKPGEKSPLGPPPPVPRKWKYELAADVNVKTGNTRSRTLGGSFKATLDGEKDKLMFFATGTQSRENGVKSTDELTVGSDYETMVGDKSSWYVRTKFETDEIALLDLRATAAAGYGQYFLKAPEHVLRGRIGLMYRHASYMDIADIPNTSSPGLDLGLYHMWQFAEWGKMVNEVTYTPAFEDWHNYQVAHTSTVDMPLGVTGAWALRLGIKQDYSSQPAEDSNRLDTTYFGQVVLSF